MAEVTSYMFSMKEIAEALVKKQGIHDGIWGISINFGLAGANTGPTADELYPTAMVPVMKIGIRQFEEEGPLAVDAGKVNPKEVSVPSV